MLLYEETFVKKLEELHLIESADGVQRCHSGGINNLSRMFKGSYHFKGSFIRIKHLASCQTCQVNKQILPTVAAPPKPIRSARPLERVQFDLVDMAPSTREFMKENKWEFRYVLAMKDYFSKYCWFFPLTSKHAKHIFGAASLLFQHEGFLEILQSDNGSEFAAEVAELLLTECGVKIKHGKPRHPQSQGQIENLKKQFKNNMRKAIGHMDPTDQAMAWPLLLPKITHVLNHSWHSTIDDVPFRVLRNREPLSLRYVLVPDDVDMASQSNGEDQNDATMDSDDDDTGSIASVASTIPATVGDFGMNVGENDIMQSCATASMSASMFREPNPAVEDGDRPIPPGNVDAEDEQEFSKRSFNLALFSMSSEHIVRKCKALESTEHTVH